MTACHSSRNYNQGVISTENKTKKKSSFKAGMYLLETLTSGMYNEPLSIYREYLQNAVDSIDLISSKNQPTLRKVNIALEPIERRIRIYDNGVGVPTEIAEQTLSAIGGSNKTGKGLRGFRGIGRLGGIAFSEKTIYRTKAEGENVESIQEWNCRELRKLLSDSQRSSVTLKEVFKHVTTFYQKNSKRPADSYFEVILEGVSSFRNYTLDIEKVRNYLSQVAPVIFNPDEFSHSKTINDYLLKNLNHYCTYNIKLNGEPIYKPYRDKVKITKKGYDYIDNIKLFEIKIRDAPVGYGWYGERRDLLGSIIKGDGSSGIRVRAGNILLGDAHLLDGCFREPRFNSYLIGEIHVSHPELIPNSRRDDFVDNEMKTLFYNEVEREIAIPVSKEIRLRSRVKSKPIFTPDRQVKNKSGPIVHIGREGKTSEARQLGSISGSILMSDALNSIKTICGNCPRFSAVLSILNRS